MCRLVLMSERMDDEREGEDMDEYWVVLTCARELNRKNFFLTPDLATVVVEHDPWYKRKGR